MTDAKAQGKLFAALKKAAEQGKEADLAKKEWQALAPGRRIPAQVVVDLVRGPAAPAGIQIRNAIIDGTIDLRAAGGTSHRSCAPLVLERCVLTRSKGAPGLDARRSHLASLAMNRCRARGVDLSEAVIEGDLVLDLAPLRKKGHCWASLHRVVVRGSATVRGFLVSDGLAVEAAEAKVAGRLTLGAGDVPSALSVAGTVHLRDAVIDGPAHISIDFASPSSGSLDAGNARFHNDLAIIDVAAPVDLTGATVEGDLTVEGSPAAPLRTLVAEAVHIGGSLALNGVAAGLLDFDNGVVEGDVLIGKRTEWFELASLDDQPPELRLTAMRVQGRLRANPTTTTARAEIDWSQSSLRALRRTKLRCFGGWDLAQALVASEGHGDLALVAFLVGKDDSSEITPLDGSSGAFYFHIKNHGLSLSTKEAAKDYAWVFCNNLWGDQVPFPLLAHTISVEDPRDGVWRVRGTVVYERGESHRVELAVPEDGIVKMVDDWDTGPVPERTPLRFHQPVRWIRAAPWDVSDAPPWPDNDNVPQRWELVNPSEARLLWEALQRALPFGYLTWDYLSHSAAARDATLRYLSRLKDAGITEPQLNFSLARLNDDLDAIRAAMEAGARTTVQPGEYLSAHRDILDANPSTPSSWAPLLDLSHSHVGTLSDGGGLNWSEQVPWPGREGWRYAARLVLDGLEYDRLVDGAGDGKARRRIRWLRASFADPERPVGDEYSPQPYQQLAQAWRRSGSYGDADRVTIEKLRLERLIDGAKGRGFLGHLVHRGLSALKKWSIEVPFRYGLDSRRALLTFVGVWVAGALLATTPGVLRLETSAVGTFVSTSNEVRVEKRDVVGGADEVPCGSAVDAAVFALDVILPFVDLRQEGTCTVSGKPQLRVAGIAIPYMVWLMAAYKVVGWAVTSGLVLTWSGIIRRQVEK